MWGIFLVVLCFYTTYVLSFYDTSFMRTAQVPKIDEWYFIGPFPIGKTEIDGDPLEAFGGIRNISIPFLQKVILYIFTMK